MDSVFDILSPHQILKHFLDAYFHELGYDYRVCKEVRFEAANTLEGALQSRTLALKSNVGANIFLAFEDKDKDRVGNGSYQKRIYEISISIETLHGEYILREILSRISSFCTNYRDGSLFKKFSLEEWNNLGIGIKDYREAKRLGDTVTHRRKFWGLLKYRIDNFLLKDLGVSRDLLEGVLGKGDLSFKLVNNSILQMQDIIDPGEFQESDIEQDKSTIRYRVTLDIYELFFLKEETRFDADD